MTSSPDAGPRGLGLILLATAVAGASGYAIQLLAASALPEADSYLSFSAFWSMMFLFGGAIGGVQQEVARASLPRAGGNPSRHALRAFSLVALAAVMVTAVVAGSALTPVAFAEDPFVMAVALGVGLLGYLFTSIATGLFYGLGRVAFVAALIIVDAVLRGVAVVIGLIVGFSPGALAFAIAIPFGFAVAAVWAVVRRQVIGQYVIDEGAAQLVRNALRTVGAAAATGLMVTGMPLLFRIFLTESSTTVVAALTLVVTLTRAPMIIPLMALQSYLVVDFRDAADRANAKLGRLLLAAFAVAVVLAVVAWFVGPGVISVVSGERYAVDSFTSSAVIVSAALVAMLCISGPALVAQRRHTLYLAGWVVAAVATIALLGLVPLPATSAVLLAITVAPLLGLIVHLGPMSRAPRQRASRESMGSLE